MVCIFEAWHINQVASVTKCEAVSIIIPTESVIGEIAGEVLPSIKEENR